jgi:hypothetical protein
MDKFKIKILSYFSVVISFFIPLAPLLVLVFFAVVADTFVGRWYARRIGEEIISKKTREGFTAKMVSYCGGLTFVFLLDSWVLNELVMMYFPKDHLSTLLTALFLIWIEYTSIDEKVKWATGNGITDRAFDFVKKVKKGLGIIRSVKPD